MTQFKFLKDERKIVPLHAMEPLHAMVAKLGLLTL